MAADKGGVLVPEWDIKAQAASTAFLGGRNQSRTLAKHTAHRRTKLGMQNGSGVLQFLNVEFARGGPTVRTDTIHLPKDSLVFKAWNAQTRLLSQQRLLQHDPGRAYSGARSPGSGESRAGALMTG